MRFSVGSTAQNRWGLLWWMVTRPGVGKYGQSGENLVKTWGKPGEDYYWPILGYFGGIVFFFPFSALVVGEKKGVNPPLFTAIMSRWCIVSWFEDIIAKKLVVSILRWGIQLFNRRIRRIIQRLVVSNNSYYPFYLKWWWSHLFFCFRMDGLKPNQFLVRPTFFNKSQSSNIFPG